MTILGEEVGPMIEVKASREQATVNRGDVLNPAPETKGIVVGIENKVYQALDNPLDDYRNYLDKLAGERRVFSGVLSLNVIPQVDQQRTPAWRFVNDKDLPVKAPVHRFQSSQAGRQICNVPE